MSAVVSREKALAMFLESRRAQGLPEQLPVEALQRTAAEVRAFLADEAEEREGRAVVPLAPGYGACSVGGTAARGSAGSEVVASRSTSVCRPPSTTTSRRRRETSAAELVVGGTEPGGPENVPTSGEASAAAEPSQRRAS